VRKNYNKKKKKKERKKEKSSKFPPHALYELKHEKTVHF